MYGGERRDLMKNRKDNFSSVPASIQLLFDNEKLELMKVLCLMNTFSIQSKKQRKVGEILFYYSLVNFNLIKIFNSELEKDITPSPNLYFRFQTKINNLLLNLSHLQFIELKGDISKKLDDLKVKLLPHGKKFFEDNKSKYLLDLQEKYLHAFNEIGFTAENIKIIKGMKL